MDSKGFKSRTHVIAEKSACVVGAADVSAVGRPPTDVAGAWRKVVEKVDALSNASSVAEAEDIAVGRRLLRNYARMLLTLLPVHSKSRCCASRERPTIDSKLAPIVTIEGRV